MIVLILQKEQNILNWIENTVINWNNISMTPVYDYKNRHSQKHIHGPLHRQFTNNDLQYLLPTYTKVVFR